MRQLFRKTLSALTAAALLCALALPAAASEALGEELTAKDTQLHDQTQREHSNPHCGDDGIGAIERLVTSPIGKPGTKMFSR